MNLLSTSVVCACRYVSYRFWVHYIGAVPDTWVLAQSRGRDKAAFEFILSRRQKGVSQLVHVIVSVFKRFAGRPHLGKTIRPQDIAYAANAKVYGAGGSNSGGFSEWEKIRSRYDPDKVFLNDPLRQFVTLALLDEEKAQNQPVFAATEIVA
jgi:hypothetical protein